MCKPKFMLRPKCIYTEWRAFIRYSQGTYALTAAHHMRLAWHFPLAAWCWGAERFGVSGLGILDQCTVLTDLNTRWGQKHRQARQGGCGYRWRPPWDPQHGQGIGLSSAAWHSEKLHVSPASFNVRKAKAIQNLLLFKFVCLFVFPVRCSSLVLQAGDGCVECDKPESAKQTDETQKTGQDGFRSKGTHWSSCHRVLHAANCHTSCPSPKFCPFQTIGCCSNTSFPFG